MAGPAGLTRVKTSTDANEDSPKSAGESMQTVNRILGQRTHEAEGDGKKQAGPPGRRKLVHISGFISGKDNGSLRSTDQEMTGKLCWVPIVTYI